VNPAVIFLHVPKTAGSTLRGLLARQFPPGAVWAPEAAQGPHERAYLKYLRGEAPRPRPPAPRDPNRRYVEQLAALPEDRLRSLGLLMGHFWFGLHEALPMPSTYVVMMRDPVARVLSHYAHRRAHHGYEGSLEDYTHEARDWELDNGQTRRLAGAGGGGDPRFAPMTDATLERAKANLESHAAVVGTTERFDEFLVLCKEAFGWRRLAYAPRNVSAGRPREQDLAAGLLAAIRARNEADLELYRHAVGLVAERTAGRRDAVEAKVRRLRRRTALYRRGRPAASAVRKKALGARIKLGRALGRRGGSTA
jgi:hypothetical protein